MVDGKGIELLESIEGELMVRRVRGIGPELSEDDEFQEEQRARLRDENGRRMTMKLCYCNSYSNCYRPWLLHLMLGYLLLAQA